MARVKQLTVSLENQPGRLAALAKVLADAKVNIEAVLGSTTGEQGSAQLVVDNAAKAKKALSPAQFAYTEERWTEWSVPTRRELSRLAAKLGRNGVNIDDVGHPACKMEILDQGNQKSKPGRPFQRRESG